MRDPAAPIRLVVDAHSVTAQRSGIGEYTWHLCHALLGAHADAIALHVYANNRIVPVADEGMLADAVEGTPEGGFYSPRHQVDLAGLLDPVRYDLFHSPDFFVPFITKGVPVVATIHDIVPLLLPHLLARSKKTRFPKLFEWTLRATASKARRIITDAQSSKRDIMRRLGIGGGRIDVIPLASTIMPHGVRRSASHESAAAGGAAPWQSALAERPYLLYVGRRDPYKGLTLLIEALRRLRAGGGWERLALVVTGPDDARYGIGEAIAAAGMKDVVVFSGFVPQEELPALYTGALGLVLPSLYEGFGLPVLDAMTLGTPVLCSDRGSLPEVAGDAAIIVNPEDADGFAAGLRALAGDAALRAQCIERGRVHAAGYTWAATAEATMRVYERVVKDGGRR